VGFLAMNNALYIDSTAIIKGKVVLSEGVVILPYVIIRSSDKPVIIGKNTVILEFSFIEDSIIGENCIVSHRAVIHKAKIGRNCLIGIGSIILDNTVIGDNCIIGAGSIVLSNKNIPDNSVYAGYPAKKIRDIRREDIESLLENIKNVQSQFK